MIHLLSGWHSQDIVANIFSNIGLTEVQKASFSLEHEFWPNSYKNIITDKKGQFQDSQFEDSRFEFWAADRSQFGWNCNPYLPSPRFLVHGFFTIHL
jgi:hypothetical protein